MSADGMARKFVRCARPGCPVTVDRMRADRGKAVYCGTCCEEWHRAMLLASRGLFQNMVDRRPHSNPTIPKVNRSSY